MAQRISRSLQGTISKLLSLQTPSKEKQGDGILLKILLVIFLITLFSFAIYYSENGFRLLFIDVAVLTTAILFHINKVGQPAKFICNNLVVILVLTSIPSWLFGTSLPLVAISFIAAIFIDVSINQWIQKNQEDHRILENYTASLRELENAARDNLKRSLEKSYQEKGKEEKRTYEKPRGRFGTTTNPQKGRNSYFKKGGDR